MRGVLFQYHFSCVWFIYDDSQISLSYEIKLSSNFNLALVERLFTRLFKAKKALAAFLLRSFNVGENFSFLSIETPKYLNCLTKSMSVLSKIRPFDSLLLPRENAKHFVFARLTFRAHLFQSDIYLI